jgi:hypothetical protein
MAYTIRCFIFFLAICLLHAPLSCLNKDHEAFAVNQSMKALLDAHTPELINAIHSMKTPRKKYRDGVWQFQWLPGYFIKYDINRIEGMKRIRDCIKKYNLHLITVPDKKLYHIKGRPDELSNDNYLVVVRKIEPAKNPLPISLEHVQQLSTIIKKTTYVDLTATNYLRLDNGKLCLIDTEGSFDSERLVRGYLRLLGSTHDLNSDYTPEALRYIFNEIKNILSQTPSFAPFTFMRLEQYFAKQKRPFVWDFETYCFELLKDYTPPREDIDLAHSRAFNK